MILERRCTMNRDHKPHMWSRTTRRTVTEVTPGDTFQCPGRARLGLREAGDPRPLQISADARSGRNWATEVSYGPSCTCGLWAARGECFRHGTRKTPQDAPRFLQPGPPGSDGDGPGPDRGRWV